jgi:hypothetical protein
MDVTQLTEQIKQQFIDVNFSTYISEVDYLKRGQNVNLHSLLVQLLKSIGNEHFLMGEITIE